MSRLESQPVRHNSLHDLPTLAHKLLRSRSALKNVLRLLMHSLPERMDMLDHGNKLDIKSVAMVYAYNSSSHRLQPLRSVMPVSWQPCFLALVLLPLVRTASCIKVDRVQK